MRDPNFDKPKSLLQIRRDLDKTCKVCGKTVSNFEGPGSDALCRDHQIKQKDYGGVGRIDRPHTFHRTWICKCCGKDVFEAVDKLHPGLQEHKPDVFNRLCRNRVIGDHIVRRADARAMGWTDEQIDHESNLQSLCLDCNSDKTILGEDFLPGKVIL
jgi:hypothetical protein